MFGAGSVARIAADASLGLEFVEMRGDRLARCGVEAFGIGGVDDLHDETGDERTSQGWCPKVLDTNADGRITRPWNEPGDDVDPKGKAARGDVANLLADAAEQEEWTGAVRLMETAY